VASGAHLESATALDGFAGQNLTQAIGEVVTPSDTYSWRGSWSSQGPELVSTVDAFAVQIQFKRAELESALVDDAWLAVLDRLIPPVGALFPWLPGVDIRVGRRPVYSTAIQTSVSGLERRASRWSRPRFRFSVRFNILRTLSPQEVNEVWAILDLFHASFGAAGEFWFPDPFDVTYRKCRFESDELEMERFLMGRWRTAEIRLITTGEVYGGGPGSGDLQGDALGA